MKDERIIRPRFFSWFIEINKGQMHSTFTKTVKEESKTRKPIYSKWYCLSKMTLMGKVRKTITEYREAGKLLLVNELLTKNR